MENNENGQSQVVEAPLFEFETMSGQKVGFSESGQAIVPAEEQKPDTQTQTQQETQAQIPDEYKTKMEQMEAQLGRMKEYEEQINQYKSNSLFGLLEEFESNPERVSELTELISTDFDKGISDVDLYKRGWMEQNSYPGVSKSDLEAAYNEHLQDDFIGFDPHELNFGLSGKQLINYKRMVETTRAAGKQSQEKARAEISQLKKVQSVSSQDGFNDTPEQRAEVAKFYQDKIGSLDLNMEKIGIPQEVSSLLGKDLAQSYKASMIEQVGEKPLLGLEAYFTQTENGGNAIDVQALVQDRFFLDNRAKILEAAIASGRSQGRAEMAKEMEGKMNAPSVGHNPGGQNGEQKFITLSNGTKVPI
jgi:hypothetical protein